MEDRGWREIIRWLLSKIFYDLGHYDLRNTATPLEEDGPTLDFSRLNFNSLPGPCDPSGPSRLLKPRKDNAGKKWKKLMYVSGSQEKERKSPSTKCKEKRELLLLKKPKWNFISRKVNRIALMELILHLSDGRIRRWVRLLLSQPRK